MFTMKFKVVEIRKSGLKVVHYLNGKRSDVLKDIEMFKNASRSYEMIGRKGMVVFT